MKTIYDNLKVTGELHLNGYILNKEKFCSYDESIKNLFCEVVKINNHQHFEFSSIEEMNEFKYAENGDTAIVKTLINNENGNEIYSYTAYIFNVDSWSALDGNYSADNIYFSENIKLGGEYCNVGNISVNDGEINTSGKSLKVLFNEIFTKRLQPNVSDVKQPSILVSSSNIGEYEVGTEIQVDYTVSKNPGKYPYNSTNVEFNNLNVTFNGETLTTETGVFSKVKVLDDTNLSITATVENTSGDDLLDNLGDLASNSNELKIKQGVKSSTKGFLKGFRKTFWGTSTSIVNIDDIDNNFVKSLDNSDKKNDGDKVKINVYDGDRSVILSYPSYLGDISSFIDDAAMGTEIKSSLSSKKINIYDINNENPIEYFVYILTTESVDPWVSKTYTITI